METLNRLLLRVEVDNLYKYGRRRHIKTAIRKHVREADMRSQQQRILDALRLEARCGTDFLGWDPPIARYSARIGELRAQGHRITTRPCQLHAHESRQFVFELETSDQGSLW